MQKVHYNNLNFLRFIAAFAVIIHHIEQVKGLHGRTDSWDNQSISLFGPLGVDLFFVLSGFLITSLLYIEKKQFKTISIPKFLMRRVLRIWPLYFLVFIFGFFIAPNFSALALGAPFVPVKNHFLINILLYVLFLPQIQSFLIGPILYCSQTWSVGIEENFYLVWPFLVSRFSQSTLVKVIASYIGIYILLMLAGKYFGHGSNFINNGLKFDCLLVGALFAIYNRQIVATFPFIFNKYFQLTIYVLEIALVTLGFSFNGFFWEVHAVIYGLIIINVANPETSILNMEYFVFDYLGKISYGLYMYQFIVINLVITFCYAHSIQYAIFPLTFFTIIAVAAASYHSLEKYFMKQKLKYSKISTG